MTFVHKNIRLTAAQYIGQHWCFVTMCCARRRRVFAKPQNAQWIVDELRREAAEHRFAVYAYCVMPDHLHMLVRGTEATSGLLLFVKVFKKKTAFEFEKRFHTVLWQKKYYDHLVRPKDSVEGVAGYIWMNPVRQGICASPQDYPFLGSMVEDWKEVADAAGAWVPAWKAAKGKRPA
jgi:putative transposase